MSSRWTGSRPSVGSSSSSRAGSWARAAASFTRWRCPVDMVPTARKRSSPRPTCQSASLARAGGVRGGAGRAPRPGGGRGRGPACRRAGRGARGSSPRGPARRARRGQGRGRAPRCEPGVGPVEAEHEAEEGGLAGAVGAEQPGDAVLDREGGPASAVVAPKRLTTPSVSMTAATTPDATDRPTRRDRGAQVRRRYASSCAHGLVPLHRVGRGGRRVARRRGGPGARAPVLVARHRRPTDGGRRPRPRGGRCEGR